jgi:hypothetical protein
MYQLEIQRNPGLLEKGDVTKIAGVCKAATEGDIAAIEYS